MASMAGMLKVVLVFLGATFGGRRIITTVAEPPDVAVRPARVFLVFIDQRGNIGLRTERKGGN